MRHQGFAAVVTASLEGALDILELATNLLVEFSDLRKGVEIIMMGGGLAIGDLDWFFSCILSTKS